MSVEIPKSGTRGRNVPGGPLQAVAMKVAVALHRLGLGRRMDDTPVLLLTTRGARSGQLRTNPVLSFPEGDRAWLVVASAAGSARHPAWFVNLARHPEDVWLEVEGRKVRVTPESLRGPERQEAWGRILARSPRFAGYEEKTDREMPVVRLTAAG
jgi:deazaflavin-dependent oxidoreductase (nitroreductase family)